MLQLHLCDKQSYYHGSCSNYICVINSLITYSGASYIRDLTVLISFRIALLYSTIIYPQFSMLTHWHWGNHMSPLIQAMTCCLTSPSHYLNQCWLTIAPVQVKQPWRVVGKLLIWICSAKTKQSKQACICQICFIYNNLLACNHFSPSYSQWHSVALQWESNIFCEFNHCCAEFIFWKHDYILYFAVIFQQRFSL